VRRLDLARRDADLRARRWDVIVLGGALPGVVAATRLGQRGYRVLVVEEELAARLPAPLRDPFFVGPCGSAGIVDAVLAALKIGLRDRRRIEPDPISYQVVTRSMRLDVGSPERTAQELSAWGLCKPEPAREGMAALARAADAELAVLLEAPLLRRGAGLRGLARARPAAEARRAPVADLGVLGDPGLAAFFEAQLDALANAAGTLPLPARARLLGAALLGGGGLPNAELTLRRLLRQRLEELHGELRSVRDFELVSVDPHPGVALPSRREVWVGRVLVLNAPLALVAAALREHEQSVPDFLGDAPAPRRRRIAVDLRCDPRVVPEGMGRRVIRALDPGPDGGPRSLSIARWPGAAARDAVQLVGHIAVDPARSGLAEAQRRAVEAILELLPFSEGRVLQREHAQPRWDDEGALGGVEACPGWPPEATLRLGSRRPVYALPREACGALGTEGDLLLGLRAGDAIAEDLG
jgi:hypothetical protein